MNHRLLATLAAFKKHGTFAAVGAQIGRTPSAVGLQMQNLEEELNVQLFDRSKRPPVLTPIGLRIARMAETVVEQADEIRAVARGSSLDRISIGFVSTTVQTILPKVMGRLEDTYKGLSVQVRSGLSNELSDMVSMGELDLAFVSAPIAERPGLGLTLVSAEPLYAVGPLDMSNVQSDRELLESRPFIAFNRRTWLGQKIIHQIQTRRLGVSIAMEVDSLDAIEALVMQGFGVSVLPQRLLAPDLSERVYCLPFCNPISTRNLGIVYKLETSGTDWRGFTQDLAQYLTSLASIEQATA